MFNPIITKDYDENMKKSKYSIWKYRTIVDENGLKIGGINRNEICDLNGNKVASFSCVLTQISQRDEEVKVRKYESDVGVFRLYKSYVFLGDKIIGRVRKISKRSLALIGIVLGMSATTIATIMLIETPNRTNRFTIDFNDRDDTYETTGKIGVFNNLVHPGSNGTFVFDIKNNENVKIEYSIGISEYYNKELIEEFPIKYRLKMNGLYVVPSNMLDTYVSGQYVDGTDLAYTKLVMLPRSNHEFILEWAWPFESGNDENDTLLGNENGNYYLTLNLLATYYYEEEI